ncbi:RnfABCDGE type electron transport complex subunit G [Petrotoga sp. 9PWA.NaAc.5.4]|uniref:RnfABCDGE type electron transport complex subunit G n=1 Tax=Petrotoga sp. 9PWA.NaAc.5.4 TaxID=1434328 RepID=UPI000CC82F7C|nr:RnfABCDGE type electron transport complex subunit G [Petrotoga sp. 9PWA.NaAc.5.4]PNR94636.1 electron transporter RnfG [Petrotoga sp. 9PWA.NaAc.5.4]
MRDYIKTGFILAAFMIASALLVSVVYNFVQSTIEATEFSNVLKAVEKVLEDPITGEYLITNIPKDKESLDSKIWKEDPSGVLYSTSKSAKVYSPAYKFVEGDKEIYVLNISGVGYGGDVKAIASFVKNEDGIKLNKIEITDYSQETPGLGARIGEEQVKRRFYPIPEQGLLSGVKVDRDVGANIPQNAIEEYKNQGIIKTNDVMTGSTITSRAVTNAINTAVEFLKTEGVI